MTKQEIITALEKAKRQLSLAKEQDEKDFAQKKVTKLEAQLSELADAVSSKTDTVELLAKIEKAKRQLSLAKEQDEKDFAQKKLAKLQAELGSFSDVSKATAEVQAENKEVLKEVANVVKNDTIPAEIKPKLVAKIKEEAHASMEEEKKAIKELAKAKTKPKKAKAKVRLEKAQERKKNVKDLAVSVSRKHDKDKFKDLIKRLTDTGKYDFLKGMSKEDVERDMQRLAKPMGWRFRGKGNYKNPNRAEIKAGIKTGKVYYETRPERSDVSKTVRLAKGSTIAGASSFDSWLKENNIHVYKRTYYWVADDGKGDYRHVGTKAEVMKALKDEFMQSTQKMAKGSTISGEKEFILCETVSGEGYSSPEFTVFATLKDATNQLNSKKTELEGDGYVLDEKKPTGNVVIKYDFQLAEDEDDDTDYQKLQIIEVPVGQYHLIRYEEPNEVSVQSFKSKIMAKKTLKKALSEITWEDEDEFDEYDGEDEFGAHSEDGYMGFYIVSLKK